MDQLIVMQHIYPRLLLSSTHAIPIDRYAYVRQLDIYFAMAPGWRKPWCNKRRVNSDARIATQQHLLLSSPAYCIILRAKNVSKTIYDAIYRQHIYLSAVDLSSIVQVGPSTVILFVNMCEWWCITCLTQECYIVIFLFLYFRKNLLHYYQHNKVIKILIISIRMFSVADFSNRTMCTVLMFIFGGICILQYAWCNHHWNVIYTEMMAGMRNGSGWIIFDAELRPYLFDDVAIADVGDGN